MRRVLIFFIGLMLAGCASLTTPDTFQQRLAYAAGSVTATRSTCADHFIRGSMSRENALKCLTLTDQAFKMIEAARATPGDETQVQAALTLLLQVEALLKMKEGG